MKRKIPAIFLSLLLLAPAASATFSDISIGNPHFAAVESLVEQGILEGYGDSTFKPDQVVTRAEATKIILMGMGVIVDENSVGAAAFSDVNKSDWFYDVLGTAVDLGILQGYDDGTFLPHQTVNRAEAMKILLKADGTSASMPVTAPFLDVPAGEWFAPFANFAKTWNIDPPQTDGLWHPAAEISRAQISEMVYRMQEVNETGIVFKESTNWLEHPFNTVSVTLKTPFGWNYKTDGVGAVWILDEAHGQVSLLDPYENGGTLLMTRNTNAEGLSSAEFFDQIRGHSNFPSSEISLNGYSALRVDRGDGLHYKDWYVYLPNNSLLHFQALRGTGAYSPYLEDYMNQIVESVKYLPEPVIEMTLEEIKSALNSAIQVDGDGAAMMALVDDWELIETDALGVGTGPVDYFYSPSLNLTIKYERSFDVILDLREGETTAF